jgi:hypothetical protein
VAADQFAERLTMIRNRFASRLSAKIDATAAAMPILAGAGSQVIDLVVSTYHQIHELCGTAATLGFVETGDASREIEAVLLGPFRDRRGLTTDELASLDEGLDALRAAARIDMPLTKINSENTP